MIAIVKLAVFGFIGLSVIYVMVSLYSRSVRREKLEREYDEGGISEDRAAFIERGMAEYESGLRRRLIWLVYVIPVAVMSVIIYVVNYQ